MNKKQEVLDFISKYILDKDIFLDKLMTQKESELIQEIISKSCEKPDDIRSPDGYALLGESIYMIEHFQFDASKEHAGSELSRKLSGVNKQANANSGNYRGRIDTNSDVKIYIENLVSHFVDHSEKIDNYKKALLSKFDENVSCKGLVYFIEDKTIFGAFNCDDHTPFEIVLTNEFADQWKKYSEVKFVIIGGWCGSQEYCKVYSRECINQKYKDLEKKNVLVMNRTNIINYKEKIL